jgi:hypothetical protein
MADVIYRVETDQLNANGSATFRLFRKGIGPCTATGELNLLFNGGPDILAIKLNSFVRHDDGGDHQVRLEPNENLFVHTKNGKASFALPALGE